MTELLAELCKFPPSLGSLAAALTKMHEAALLAAPLFQRVLLGSAFCIEKFLEKNQPNNPDLNDHAVSRTQNNVSWVFNTTLECLYLYVFFLMNSKV